MLVACQPGDEQRGGAGMFRVTGASPPDSPWANQWRRFGEQLAALDDQGLQPEFYVRGQLGDPDQTIHSLRRGRIQLGGFPLSAAAALVPEVAVLHAPFLFESEEEFDYLLIHHLQEPLQALFHARGVTVVQWTAAGWNHLFADRPLRHPSDLAGFPMRAQSGAGSRALLGTVGADVKPLPFSELVSALQTGLVRGGEATTVMYLASGLADEARYLTRTFHAYDAGVILANSAWWESLGSKRQQAIRDALGPPERLRAEVESESERLLAAARTAGQVEVHDLDAAELEAWRRFGAPMRRRMVNLIGGDAREILHKLEEGRSGFRVADAGD